MSNMPPPNRIQVEINGVFLDVTRQELVDLAMTEMVHPTTRGFFNGKEITLSEIKDLRFASDFPSPPPTAFPPEPPAQPPFSGASPNPFEPAPDHGPSLSDDPYRLRAMEYVLPDPAFKKSLLPILIKVDWVLTVIVGALSVVVVFLSTLFNHSIFACALYTGLAVLCVVFVLVLCRIVSELILTGYRIIDVLKEIERHTRNVDK